MELKVKNKIVEIKFDYRTRYKVNQKLATKNQETGESNNDGVAVLFSDILNRNDKGLVSLISLAVMKDGAKAVSENDVLNAIAAWLEENEADTTEALFEAIQDEMVDSGFFKEEILKYIKNLETTVGYMEDQEGITELQITALNDTIGKMKDAVS